MKKIYHIEFVLNTSPSLIYPRISTPSGLSEWFADDVNSNEDIFTFSWNGSEQQAKKIESKKNEFVKFSWLEDQEDENDNYFEFRIQKHELTGDVSLLITDFAEDDELKENQDLWEQQIYELKHTIGL